MSAKIHAQGAREHAQEAIREAELAGLVGHSSWRRPAAIASSHYDRSCPALARNSSSRLRKVPGCKGALDTHDANLVIGPLMTISGHKVQTFRTHGTPEVLLFGRRMQRQFLRRELLS